MFYTQMIWATLHQDTLMVNDNTCHHVQDSQKFPRLRQLVLLVFPRILQLFLSHGILLIHVISFGTCSCTSLLFFFFNSHHLSFPFSSRGLDWNILRFFVNSVPKGTRNLSFFLLSWRVVLHHELCNT